MLFVDIPVPGRLYLQPGLRFARLGSRSDYDFEVGSPPLRVEGSSFVTQYYLSVPLRLRYQFSRTPFFVTVGPEVGYLLTARTATHQSGQPASEPSQSVTEHMRRLNLVLGGGVGARMNLGGRAMYLQLTYGRGLLEAGDEAYWRSGLRTSELALSIGSTF